MSSAPQRNEETRGKLPQADELIHPDMRELKCIRTSSDLLLLPSCPTSTKQDSASSFIVPCDSPSGFSPAAPHPGILNPCSATPWLSRALSVTPRPPARQSAPLCSHTRPGAAAWGEGKGTNSRKTSLQDMSEIRGQPQPSRTGPRLSFRCRKGRQVLS